MFLLVYCCMDQKEDTYVLFSVVVLVFVVVIVVVVVCRSIGRKRSEYIVRL